MCGGVLCAHAFVRTPLTGVLARLQSSERNTLPGTRTSKKMSIALQTAKPATFSAAALFRTKSNPLSSPFTRKFRPK